MRIQGKDCTLTVARDGEFIPIPYSEETVRQTSKGYSLPSCIGQRNRDKTIVTGKKIEGCFTTRLEHSNIMSLFLLFFYLNQGFDIYVDRGFEKIIYKNINTCGFELRGDNGESFKLRVDVKENEDSFTDNWPLTIPDLSWERQRTYFYDGKSVSCDLKTIPLVYRFELTASFNEKIKYQIKLYFPLSSEHYPVNDRIEKLSIVIDQKDGITLDVYDLVPSGGLCDINCSDTVLCNQLFDVTGIVVLTMRNEKEFTQIIL
ncbi:hypothetical protein SAMN04487977_11083 [Treponema bryantii]|uniref:Uncharacterized protein n=1 Tax=Treponema bryantii TaxID=163 RepID=A0A1H9IRY5_9SPIR|nr:hypothetical protein [Treponema bryantii]SEQ77340.1 hypothetical protein SAMN04487977_11083 [Treponema bryantii]